VLELNETAEAEDVAAPTPLCSHIVVYVQRVEEEDEELKRGGRKWGSFTAR
jgi:hypothetical protein